MVLLALAAPVAGRGETFEHAVALHQAGRSREALTAYHAVAGSPAPAEERAAALNNACVLAGELGDQTTALRDCEAALRLRRTLGDPAAVAETANNLGLVLEVTGRPGEAAERYREALALNRKLGDRESVVVNLGNLGALALAAGHYSAAARLYDEAAAIARAAAGEPWAADQLRAARINQGVVLEKVGEYRQAVGLYRQLLAERDAGDARQRAALLVNAGVIYRNLDGAVSALAAFDEAAAIYRRLDDKAGLSNAELNRGLGLHLNLDRPRAAEAAYREALALAERGGDRTEEVQDLFYLGRFLLDRAQRGDGAPARLMEADALFHRCLAEAQRGGSAEGRWSALEGLGRIAAARGDLDAALRQLEAALAEIERVRAQLVQAPWRAGYFGDKRAVYAATVAVLARLHGRDPRRGYDARAFAVVQRAKARDLLDALGPAGKPALPRTAAELGPRLRGDVAIEYFVGDALAADGTDGRYRGDRPGTRARLFRWVLHGGRIELTDLGDAAPVLEAVARTHRALAGGGEAGAADLAALSRALLPAPLPLPARGGQLRIAPDGLLHYLPFELLRSTNGAPLVELATISYLPSTSTLARADADASATSDLRLAAFAASEAGDVPALAGSATPRAESASRRPAGGASVDASNAGPRAAGALPPLAAASREVGIVAALLGGKSELFTGPRATEASFRAAVRRRPRVLHVATHAVVEEPPGRGAAIQLVAAGDDDGRLTPPEIASAGGAARLTVLAACRTALVSPADEGRSLASLTGSVLAAGSRAVVATLWDVGDEATAAFMEQLYAQLARGLAPAEALRRAKQRLRATPGWDRPSLWAAYVLVGDGEPVVDSPWRHVERAFGSRAGVAMLAALALLAAAALAWSFRAPRRTRISGSRASRPRS
ncbi:MAG TPA: CHAT domain-containing tetratricopeptide repeat protein [Thermoanaerobaculia bacterium]|jgi:CHAT domain-containing protein/tetratricopeptide (TPR) repeat protein|nr:CHAT domain-containing tetratricopeptide repeat protein [Thermoanaerobaculia bacterium]